jgi:hypothetical protein
MENDYRTRMQEYTRELMAKKIGADGKFIEKNIEGYIISIVGREELLYQCNGRGVLVYTNADEPIVDASSIKFWDDLSVITESERDLIIKRIIDYFRNYQNVCVTIV